MPRIIRIQDPEDPRIGIYRTIKGHDIKDRGLFVAESKRVVRALLEQKFDVKSFISTEKTYNHFRNSIPRNKYKKTPE